MRDTFFHYSSPNWFTTIPINQEDTTFKQNAIFRPYFENLYVTNVKVIMNGVIQEFALKPYDSGRYTLQQLVTGDSKTATPLSSTTVYDQRAINPFGFVMTTAQAGYSTACDNFGETSLFYSSQ
jgi:hypothetical protein